MAAVMRERPLPSFSKRRVHTKSSLQATRSPRSVLLPESPGSSSAGSVGDQIVECTSFRNGDGTAEAVVEQVDDDYTCFMFVSIDRPSDLLVEVDDITFHLHKLPLLSRSGLLFRLASSLRCDEGEKTYVSLVDVPGGVDAFITVVKFCYGVVKELTPTNVVTVRCAAEYLEMTEAFEEGNVISKTEAYLDLVIFNSWQESIVVLQSCELLLPWAEDTLLVKRCAESVADKACTDPEEVRWLYSSSAGGGGGGVAPRDWWYEDVSHLTVYCFSEVVDAVKVKGMQADLLGGALEYYAHRWLPGLLESEGACGLKVTESCNPTKLLHESMAEHNRRRFILQEIVSLLPEERDAFSCRFLLRTMRAACMLNCDVACKADLEKRAGLQLEHAAVSDLLIPCFSRLSESLFDVDLVRRVVDHFLTQAPPLNLRAKVAKLLDTYLAEVARDSRLPVTKFQYLAEALPGGSRLCDDGLYRAVDTYLKIHPNLSEHERKRMCRVLNCHRLSLDACTHASQNERLPLRFVVQVLFCEQLKIRSTVKEVSNAVKDNRCSATLQETSSAAAPSDIPPSPMLENLNQQEIRALQKELANMRERCNDLERGQGSIQDQVGDIARVATRRSSLWSSRAWKRRLRLHLFQKDHEITSSSPSTSESRSRFNSIS